MGLEYATFPYKRWDIPSTYTIPVLERSQLAEHTEQLAQAVEQTRQAPFVAKHTLVPFDTK
jgi:hypothetical protein